VDEIKELLKDKNLPQQVRKDLEAKLKKIQENETIFKGVK
jgi:hypothetical protein